MSGDKHLSGLVESKNTVVQYVDEESDIEEQSNTITHYGADKSSKDKERYLKRKMTREAKYIIC